MVPECCFSEWEQEIWLYLDGELSPEDRLRVERHLENCRRCREFLADVQPFQDRLYSHFQASAESHPLSKNFTRKIMSELPGMVPKPWHKRLWSLLRYNLTGKAIKQTFRYHPVTAMALFLVCAVTLFSIWLVNQGGHRSVTVKPYGGEPFKVGLSENMRCDSPEGEVLELPDGSLMVARSGAVFSIDAYQNDGEGRWISLRRGTVLFDVQTVPMEGFTVTTPQATVKVMGTCFAVALDGRETKVEVASGSVLVEDAGKEYAKYCILKSGERVMADHKRGLLDWSKIEQCRVRAMLAPFDRIRSEPHEPPVPKSNALFNVPQ